jgi:hypothetical protein
MPIIQQLTLTTPKLGHKYYMYQVYCTTASQYYTLHIIHGHTVVAEGCTHAEVRHGRTTLQLHHSIQVNFRLGSPPGVYR